MNSQTRRFTRRAFAALAVVAAVATGAVMTQTTPAAAAGKPKVFQTSDGVAIHGYDPVAYFTMKKPTKGDAKYSLKWNGATWHFASAKHRDMFKANPAKYAPQFGGYCAYGVSQGGLVPIEADKWAVHKGKLYLNYNAKVQGWWNKDRDGWIAKARAKEKAVFKNTQ